jgi:maltose alpha-D-glucosyltransferase/alpha-amylase
MVTDVERDYMWDEYARDPVARINLGIRRRLAPLMDNDRRRMELLNGVLFTLNGSPFLYYGDEIGMGDNVALGDRNGVRTPMQWSPDRNAGFSTADPDRLYLPLINHPSFGYPAVNVEAQRASPSSLLNWMKELIRVRKTSHVFGRGSIRFLEPRNHRVVAFLREWEEDNVLVVANFSSTPQVAEVELAGFEGAVPVEMFGNTIFPRVTARPYVFTLSPYAFFWLRLRWF